MGNPALDAMDVAADPAPPTEGASAPPKSTSPPVQPASDLPDPSLPWTVPYEAVVLSATKEGLGPMWKKQRRIVAYLCPAGKWTLGWGETAGIYEGMEWTKQQADQNLCDRMRALSNNVSKMLTKPANWYQLGALCVFADNIGLGSPRDTKEKKGFYWSSVRRLHNEGKFIEASRAFGLQNQFFNIKTGKKEVSNGLSIRRAQEAALYVTPDPNQISDDTGDEAMPQIVEAEKPMTKSPINQSQVVSGITGLGLVTKGLTDHADETKTAIDSVQGVATSASGVMGSVHETAAAFGFHFNFIIVAGLIVLVACSVAVYYRLKQRNNGMA